MIEWGLDAICWHGLLVAGEMRLEDVLEECEELEVAVLQVGLASLSFADSGPEDIAALARSRGVRLRATGGPVGPRFHQTTDDAVRAVRDQLRLAGRLESRSLMVYSGSYRPYLLEDPGRVGREQRHLRQVLPQVAQVAAEQGQTVELENASDLTTDELVDVLGFAPTPGFSFFLDLTNPYNVFNDPVDAARRLGPLTRAGHVKDFTLHSVFSADRYHRHGFDLRFCLPGQGISQIAESVRALAASTPGRDQSLPLCIEGLDAARSRQERRRDLAASLAWLRTLDVREVGPAEEHVQ